MYSQKIKNSLLMLMMFSLFLFPNSSFATDWQEASNGDIQNIRSITKSGDNLVAVGNSGKIIYSKDGTAWTESASQASAWFFKVKKQNNGNLLAIGQNGLSVESSDNGLTWSQISFGITKDIFDFEAKGETGYMVGSAGTYLYYDSNSKNWLSSSVGLTTDLYGAHDMGNNSTGWLVGKDGKIIKVSQRGLSYSVIANAITESLYDIKFISSTTGFAVGLNGTVLKSTDSGASWTKLSIAGLSDQSLYSIDSSGSNMAIAGDKVLLVSEDSGTTWKVKDFSNTLYTFREVYFENETILWAVGTDYDVKSLVYKYDLTPPVVEAPPKSDLEPETETVPPEADPGKLIKLVCTGETEVNDPCRAVYFYATDGKRHAFPNDKVFFTWFDDFSSVKEVSAKFMASLALGKNVTYHPGTKMVKFQSMNTVYVVSKKGELRAVGSENIAKALYGDTGNKQIDDISDAFFGNYVFGAKIENTNDYRVDLSKESVTSLNDNF